MPDCLEAANSAWQVSPCASIVHCHGWLAGWLAGWLHWWSLASVTTGPRRRARRRGGSINYLLHVLALGTPPSSWLAAWQLAGWLGGTTHPAPNLEPARAERTRPGRTPAASHLAAALLYTHQASPKLAACKLLGWGPAGGDPKEAPECLRDGGSRHATSKILGRKSRWHSCLLSGNIETGRPGASYINFN